VALIRTDVSEDRIKAARIPIVIEANVLTNNKLVVVAAHSIL
jgi:uncharacterized protein (UPF0216 family)